MAEQACQEAVAYDLMRDIMFEDPDRPKPNCAEFRAYTLDLFAECLIAVNGKRTVSAPPSARLLPHTSIAVESCNENCTGGGNGTAKQIDPMRNKKRLQQAQA